MDSLMGFRFKPTDEEIILLLRKKRLEPHFSVPTIKEIDIYKFEPWELPRFCVIQSKEEVWYFFCEPYYKYAKSKRAHRRTKTGYWKVTGKGSTMKAKNSGEVIGNKKFLPFCSNSTASKKANTEWVMHEISIGDDPLYKKDYVICRIERKRDTKLGISTRDEDQPSRDLANCYGIDVTDVILSESDLPLDQHMVSNRNHVAEKIFSKTDNFISQSKNHVAENTGLDLISYSRNHVAENTGLDLISYSRNHVAENTCAEPQVLPSHSLVSYSGNNVAEISALESQVLASQNLDSYSRKHVGEIASPESQQLANHNLISHSRNHVAENSSTKLHPVASDNLESLKLPNLHSVSYSTNSVEYTFETEPQLPAEFNLYSGYTFETEPRLPAEFNPYSGYTFETEPRLPAEFNLYSGYDGLNNASFSPLQSLIYAEQESSNFNDSSFGCDLLDSQFYSERSPRDFQNESSHEEPGQTFTPDFNSSKSNEYSREASGQTFSPDFNSYGGICVENGSDAFTTWINEL